MSKSRSRSRYRSRKGMLLRACIGLLLAAAALAGLYALGRSYEQNAYPEERQQASESFGRLHAVEYDGAIYLRRPEVTTVLVMGVDREEGDEPEGFRDGGQADFLMLVALDHKNNTVSRLQIDRDAVTDVPVVGVLGNDAGTRRMQICLAHAYGGSEEDRCRHTVQAAANLLAGETAQQYMSLMLDDIAALRADLGAVIQVNAGSILRPRTFFHKRWIRRVLSRGLCDVVASDAHDDHSRPCRMRAVYDLLVSEFGSDTADALCVRTPRKLLGLDAAP